MGREKKEDRRCEDKRGVKYGDIREEMVGGSVKRGQERREMDGRDAKKGKEEV